ncbi:zinc finger protein 57 [Ditylenchus destructor]|nr:zinc finger protein 57 [Ditylenchus destructor]
MNRFKRIAPRIVSRSMGKQRKIDDTVVYTDNIVVSPSSSTIPSNGLPHSSPSVPDDIEAIEVELQSEVVVKGGMVVRLHNQNPPDPPLPHALNQRPSQDSTMLTSSSSKSISSNQEKYPASSSGPWSHRRGGAVLAHHQYLQNMGRTVSRSIQPSATRNCKNSTVIVMRKTGANRIPGINQKDQNMINNGSGAGISSDQYGMCKTCGIMINTQFPASMQNHMEMHRKNDVLKRTLLKEYGSEAVQRLTCKDCAIVFADERRLVDHVRTNHTRKKRFVCRWCGKIFGAMTDLNVHKSLVHNISANANRHESYVPPMTFISQPPAVHLPAKIGALGSEAPSIARHEDLMNSRKMKRMNSESDISDENVPCRTTCGICGLVIVRPSLLLRHMLRVHNQRQFNAEILSQQSSPLKFEIGPHGKVTWWCCNNSFNDRSSVLNHRLLNHNLSSSDIPPVYTQVDIPFEDTANLQPDGVPITCQEVLLGEDDSPQRGDMLDSSIGESAMVVDNAQRASPPSIIAMRPQPHEIF